MDYQTELDVRDIMVKNYNDTNISFPAVVVGIENIKDGLVDVRPIVNYMNSYSRETYEYPVIYNVPLVFPNTGNSSICFPVNQGDFLSLVFQSKPVRDFINGNGEVQDPIHPSVSDLSQVVAFVGFVPYQQSALNPNNYIGDFDPQDLNIVHNKGSNNEVAISLKTDGGVVIRSNSNITIESPTVDIPNSVVNIGGDINIAGKSLTEFVTLHSHTDSKGGNTSPPTS